MYRLKSAGWFIFVSIFSLSCAGGKESMRSDNQPGTSASTGIVEDLDPEALDKVNFEIEPRYKSSGENASRAFLNGENNENLEGKAAPKRSPGYRIQVGSLSSQDDAQQIQRTAMLQFEDHDVYLIFETPYYKIRVGDFDRRRDAEELQQKAVELGYGEAWIVRTVIEKEE